MWRGWPGSRSPRSPAPFGVWTGSPRRPASACCASRRTCTTSPPPRRRRSRRDAPASSAVVAPFLTRWFFATLVSAIEKSLRARGHHVILFDLEDDSYDQRLPLSQNMLWKRVDGVITLNVPMTTEEVELVDRLGLPLVAIGSPVPGRACVRIDDQAAMRTAVEHLAGLGHTRIGYIGAVPQNVAHIQTPQDRLEAFLVAVGRAGPDLRRRLGARLRLDGRGRRPRQRRAAVRGRTARPRSSRPRTRWPSACARAPGDSGMRVPEDLSIIGIDDYVLSGVLGLTTVRQDVAGLGTRRRRAAAAGAARRRPVDRRGRHADRARAARVDRPRAGARTGIRLTGAGGRGGRPRQFRGASSLRRSSGSRR